MVPFLWISIVFLVNFGKCEPMIRHHSSRYLALGSRYPIENGSYPRSQASPYAASHGFRPLFSWDPPTEPLSQNSTGNNNSARKPIWHVPRRRPNTYFKTAKATHRPNPATHSPPQAISFRKSYTYNSIPSEEAKPKPSKKVIYVVSRRGRPSGRQGGKICKNPRKCLRKGERRRYPKVDGNETVKNQMVDQFPKGLVAENSAGALGNAWEYRRNKHRKNGVHGIRTKTHSYSLCSTIPRKCDQFCTEENGRATCSCYSGFVLVNGTKCMDVDECRINNGGCDGQCVNTVGSRRCLCPEGFRLSGEKCVDVNECLLRNGHGPCQDTCVNTRGGYYCTCDGIRGTVLSRDNHTCEEVNGCNSGAAGCSHSCISTFGRSFCTCPDGYELGDDWKTCHDIDECSEMQDNCRFRCINTIGSYYCEMTNALSGG